MITNEFGGKKDIYPIIFVYSMRVDTVMMIVCGHLHEKYRAAQGVEDYRLIYHKKVKPNRDHC